jgi:lipid-A-disaccharide synthase
MTLPHKNSAMVVVGDPSADEHAARLIQMITQKNKTIRFFGMGGPKLSQVADIREDLTHPALAGFIEIVRYFPLILKRYFKCVQWLKDEKPTFLFLVDYPGFNLQLAKVAKKQNIPVIYYIAPQVWAWNSKRLKLMKKVIDYLLVIFPFEETYFQKEKISATYVGHPLIQEIPQAKQTFKKTLLQLDFPFKTFPLICMMPGSRKSEIDKMGPLFLRAAYLLLEKYPSAVFLIPCASPQIEKHFKSLLLGNHFKIIKANDYYWRKSCHMAWVKSGTSTLETALLGTPMVVVYKMTAISSMIAKRWVRLSHVAIVNLLGCGSKVPELLLEKAIPENIVECTIDLLQSSQKRSEQVQQFLKIKKLLSFPEFHFEFTTRKILNWLKAKNYI